MSYTDMVTHFVGSSHKTVNITIKSPKWIEEKMILLVNSNFIDFNN